MYLKLTAISSFIGFVCCVLAGKIQISESTKQQLEQSSEFFDIELRGVTDVKVDSDLSLS